MTDERTGPLSRASLQSTEHTRTYPCHRCGGSLIFDIGRQQLACPSCGHTEQVIENTGGRIVEHDLRAAWGTQRSTSTARFVGSGGAAPAQEIICQNCGGHTTFTGTLTAVRCPYCATPIQRDDIRDAPDRLPVDAVLPFQVDEAFARSEVRRWIDGRWFAPSEFKKYNQAGALSSVYLAYFTYDATAVTDYAGERATQRTVVIRSGGEERLETRTDWHRVSGRVVTRFDDVPVLANTGLDSGKIRALEPWPTEHAQPYSAEYVAGHLSRTYDVTVEEAFQTAKTVMDSTVDADVRRDIGGDEQRIHRADSTWYDMTFKHVLLPIWLLTVVYDGRPFHLCINGFTGEVQGSRPYSAAKIVVAVVVGIAVALLVAVIASSLGHPHRHR